MSCTRDYPEAPEDKGPAYPDLGPGVAKFRRMASCGIAAMDPTIRRAYGEAVESAIKAKQRSELLRAVAAPPPLIKDVGAYIRSQQRAALAASVGRERRARKPHEWQAMYEEAMSEKRNGPTDIRDDGRRNGKGTDSGKVLRSAPRVRTPSRRRSGG